MENQSFDDAVTNFITPDGVALAEVKQRLAPTAAALRDLQRFYSDNKAPWLTRVAAIERRQQRAIATCGVHHPDVAKGLEELRGGRALSGGLILSTENQINGSLSYIEQISLQDLSQRNRLLYLESEPAKVGANIAAIKQRLAQLEELVKDGGELQQMIQEKSGQAAPVVSVSTQHERPVSIPVEQDFAL